MDTNPIYARSDVDTKPWYCYGWPWFLISIPLISVGLGLSMLYLGMSTNNSLVVDDYYKAGKAINQRIARDVRATEYGMHGELFQADDGVVLTLSHQSVDRDKALVAVLNPERVIVKFVHVTRASLDLDVTAQHIGGGRYIAQDTQMPLSDRWRIHIYPELEALDDMSWRLVSREVALAPSSTVQVDALPAI